MRKASQVQAAFGGDIGIVLCVVEKEIVENDFVEVARGDFSDVLDVVALFGVGVAEGYELAAAGIGQVGAGSVAAADVGNATGYLDVVRDEEGFDGFKVRVGGDVAAAIGLDVDLVDFHLAGKIVP